MIKIRQIEYKSEEYFESLRLREKILRKPLGMVFTADFLQGDKDDFHLCAFVDGKIKAVLLLKPLGNKILKMRQVAVDSDMQGRNLGTLLVKYAEDFALSENFSHFVLNARATAVNFYLRMNYKIVGNEFLELGISHFKMEKILTIV